MIINEAMGANFSQITHYAQQQDGEIKGQTNIAEIFFYVIKGKCHANVGGGEKSLTQGHYVYVPVETPYQFNSEEEDTQVLSFHKVYETLAGVFTSSSCDL